MEAFSVYSATKAALRSFARTWTTDLKARKIRVNTLSPGLIETPIFGKAGLNEEQAKDFKGFVTQQVPLGRIGHVDEIAKPAERERKKMRRRISPPISQPGRI